MMVSQIEELEPLSLGKGTVMRLFIDKSKAEGSPDYNWTEVTWEGDTDDPLLIVPAHWHKDHDEVVEILVGRLKVKVDGVEKTVAAGDPPVLIERGQVHSFVSYGVRTVVTERTIPSGTFKALFFQDLLQYKVMPGFFLTMRVFYEGDCYAALPGGFKALDILFITMIGLLAKPFVAAKPKEVKYLTS